MKRDLAILLLILIVVAVIGAYLRLEATGYRWECLFNEPCKGDSEHE